MSTETKIETQTHIAVFSTDAIYGVGSGPDFDSAWKAACVDAENCDVDPDDIGYVTSIRGPIEGFVAAQADLRLIAHVADRGGCGFAFEFNPRTGLLDLQAAIMEELEGLNDA